ncbi:MAG TPA: chemotaxis protein CheB [Ramlibacter sp.]|nr:chemotaxis protein CheB [Ramlibacter sp.]
MAEQSGATQARDDDRAPACDYDPLSVVGLGGSAGSITALKTFFEAMPTDSGLAFVVVLHLPPGHESTLAELLQRATAMPVTQVSRAVRIESDHVYVIPPRYALKVEDGMLELQEMPADPGRHVAVDLFFATLADTYGPHSAAVVLSGADGDGAIGIKRVKERGGLTIAQDPEESEHAGMPRASIATGMVDWVLPAREIPRRLLDYFNLEDKRRLPPESINIDELGHAKSDMQMRLWLSAIVTASSDAIISFSLDGSILSWNGGAERIFGHKAGEAVGKHLSILAAGNASDQQALVARIASAQAIENHETVRRRRDGSELHVSISISPIRDESGKVIAGTAVVRDITESKRSADALVRALADTEKARADLLAADAAKDRFLAVLSHELRNPLASIDSASGLMTAPDARAEDVRDAARVVQRQARGMKMLLDDLQDVSRMKLGRLELKRSRVRLSAIVGNALETTKSLLQEAGHTLNLDMPPGDIELDGDAARLGQVLSNLLANAIRYTPWGGTIAVGAKLVAGELEMTVKDSGMGMDPAEIESMFEMFTQGASGKDRAQGLGIGLALVKSLVEMHGGRVSAQSAGPGKGSEFRVVLPGAVASARAPADSGNARDAKPATCRRGLVVVADDNEDAGWGMAKMLELSGFGTVRVTSGTEALKVIELRRPDAAVIDIGMPDLIGHEVARRVRAADWGRKIVLVAATGWGQEADEREAAAAGFDAHMTKPVDARKLVAVLDSLLAARRR